jgi:hypothetical protein
VLDVRVGPAWIRTSQPGGGTASVPLYRAATASGQTLGAAYDVTCIGPSGRFEIDRCPVIPAAALEDFVGEETIVGFAPGDEPAAIDDSGITAFAVATLTKTESWGVIEAEYFRREDAAAGSGSTTVRDSFTGTIAFRPGWGLDVQARANWNRREATSDVNRSIIEAGPSTIATGDGRFFAESIALIPNVVTDDFEIKQVWADLIVGRTVFVDALRFEGRFRYLRQERPDQPIVGTFESFAGEVRLIYEFTALRY